MSSRKGLTVIWKSTNKGLFMGQVKIYGLEENIKKNRDEISRAIHQSITTALEFPKEKKFHRFISLSREDFIFPDSRTENYLIIEIVMFKGRSDKTKKRLIDLLFKNLESIGIKPLDLEITLIEEPPENWGIRGTVGSELKINYTVEI